MNLVIVPKHELSADQLRHLDERLSAPEHGMDRGPNTVWVIYTRGLYAIIDQDTGVPIGVVEASGPMDQMGAGWWLDSKVRGKGAGSDAVDALAAHLKSIGVT